MSPDDAIIVISDDSDQEINGFERPITATTFTQATNIIEILSDEDEAFGKSTHSPIRLVHDAPIRSRNPLSSPSINSNSFTNHRNNIFPTSDPYDASTDIVINEMMPDIQPATKSSHSKPYSLPNGDLQPLSKKTILSSDFDFSELPSLSPVPSRMNYRMNSSPSKEKSFNYGSSIVIDDIQEIAPTFPKIPKPVRRANTFGSSFISDLSEIDLLPTKPKSTIPLKAKRSKEDILSALLDSDDDDDDILLKIQPQVAKRAKTTIPITKAYAAIPLPPTRSKTTIDNVASSPGITLPMGKRTQKATEAPYSQKDLKEANKTNRPKEDYMTEMIILFEENLHNDFSAELDFKSKLKFTEVKAQSSVFPMISWERKVKAKYNAEEDLFIPIPPTTIKEKTFALYYNASDFVSQSMDGTIQSHFRQVTNQIDCEGVIVCLEGYDQYLQKLKTSQNRKYAQKVRQALGEEESTTTRKSKKAIVMDISHEEVEDFVANLQIRYKLNIFPVKNKDDALDWLEAFTYTIACSIYDKTERNLELANVGVIKSGIDAKDTYLESLKQFKFMTAPAADRIYNEYRSMQELYMEIKRKGKLAKGPDGKNLTRPSIEQCLKTLLQSDDPTAILAEQ